MATPELFQQMVVHIGEYLEQDASHLHPESPLRSAVAGLDSLKTLEMILYLEECFGVEFEDDLMTRIETMGELADHIETSMAAKDAVPVSQ
jgi:acyl carrier protein